MYSAMDLSGYVHFGKYKRFFNEGFEGKICPYQCGDGKLAWEEGNITRKFRDSN